MNRNEFLSQMVKLGLGFAAMPLVLQSCFREEFDVQFNGNLVIVGAGAAGLYAAYLLKKFGIEVKVLEAAPHIGGRIGKHEGFADFPLDRGAQWMHSSHSIIGDLVRETNTAVFYDNSADRYYYKGALESTFPDAVQSIISKMEESSPNISLEEHFYNSGGTADEFNFIYALAAESGASPRNLSVKWEDQAYKLATTGSDDYKFEKTYFDLFEEHIVPEIKADIVLNAAVTEINYEAEKALVKSAQGSFPADAVIVTVPLTILQNKSIRFVPPLPVKKEEAFSQLAMEAGTKAYLKFSDHFTDSNVVGGTVCSSYVLESYKRAGDSMVLMCFLIGDQAKNLSDSGESETVKALLAELDSMFENKASASFEGAYIQDWLKEPFVQGAYSYPTKNANERTREHLASSVQNKIFFAGEATNTNGHHQSVHGAVETAYREVMSLVRKR